MAQSALPSLPIELIPTILQSLAFLYDELARIALTCRAFHQAAMPLLYAYVRIRDTSLVSKVCLVSLGFSTKIQADPADAGESTRSSGSCSHARTARLAVWQS
jgi:hypothetical protein